MSYRDPFQSQYIIVLYPYPVFIPNVLAICALAHFGISDFRVGEKGLTITFKRGKVQLTDEVTLVKLHAPKDDERGSSTSN